ncbi:sensor histidine kinase [Actinocorallia libanotica]|uniref:histidine kinase n=1 Tax=Actinocorallia libanotica TaxID=46162 RepID=A0ABP4AWW4_9ACTN
MRPGLVERVRSLDPLVQDGLLAALLFAATFGAGRLEGRAGLLLQAALVLPLVGRRRAPRTVFALICGAALVQWLLGLQLPADAALLVALYTVAAWSERRWTVAAAVVLTAGIVLASWRWSPDGRFLASVAALTAMAAVTAVLGSNIRDKRTYLSALEDRAVRLEHERDQRARLAAAEERTRIAREMHDIVTHNLSVMVALTDAAVYAQEHSPAKATAVMHQISETGRQALTDMRRSLGVLRAGEPDAERHPPPGIAQLEPLAAQMRATGLATRLEVLGDPAPVPATAQLTVYRLVQEALTNTLKHSPSGTRAEVAVRCSPDAVDVDVTDDGPAPSGPSSPGQGLAGMRERTTAYGGSFAAGPRPGGGWRVHARLDLAAEGAAA